MIRLAILALVVVVGCKTGGSYCDVGCDGAWSSGPACGSARCSFDGDCPSAGACPSGEAYAEESPGWSAVPAPPPGTDAPGAPTTYDGEAAPMTGFDVPKPTDAAPAETAPMDVPGDSPFE